MVTLEGKLTSAKIALNTWNREVFSRVDQNIWDLEARLVELEEQLQRGYVKEIKEDFLIT